MRATFVTHVHMSICVCVSLNAIMPYRAIAPLYMQKRINSVTERTTMKCTKSSQSIVTLFFSLTKTLIYKNYSSILSPLIHYTHTKMTKMKKTHKHHYSGC